MAAYLSIRNLSTNKIWKIWNFFDVGASSQVVYIIIIQLNLNSRCIWRNIYNLWDALKWEEFNNKTSLEVLLDELESSNVF